MAEGWVKKLLPDWNVKSAGLEANGLNANAIKAMKEVHFDIANHTSDIIDGEILNQADIVVTLCGHADEHCPLTPPHVRREHWGFDDSAKVEGTDDKNGLSSNGYGMKLVNGLNDSPKQGNR